VVGHGSEVWLRSLLAWTSVPVGVSDLELTGVFAVAASDLWVTGGALLRGDASGGLVAAGACDGAYTAIHGSSASDVWLAGAAGAICHFDGTSFSKLKGGTSDLLAVWSGPGATWFVGTSGTTLRHGANGLQPFASATTATLRGIWGASANDVWAVGDQGTIVHFDGQIWSKVSSPTSLDLWAVWGSSATRVFAVGTKNTALRLQP
jgi:hypothetical protein